jgi:hypothetical protein
MKLFKKTYWLIYPVLIVFFMLIFDQFHKTDGFLLKAFVSGFVAFIISPRKKIIHTQTGKIKQITWIFLKKPVLLES